MTDFVKIQQATLIIRDSSEDINRIFTEEKIITKEHLWSVLQQAKNIVGWAEILLSTFPEEKEG